MAFSAIGIFCEDIRQEKSEQDTLIGILPDNVNVPSIPGMFPKLGLVVRMHFDVSSSARQFFVILRQSGQPDLRVGDPDDQLIQQAVRDANANKLPFAGVVAKAILSPFKVNAYGLLEIVMNIDGVDHVVGALNLKPLPGGATASAPPTSQFPSAAPATSSRP